MATDPELAPRQKIASVPYAMVAEKAASADSAAVAQTVAAGAVGAAQIADGAISSNHVSPALRIPAGSVTFDSWSSWQPTYFKNDHTSPLPATTIFASFVRVGPVVFCKLKFSTAVDPGGNRIFFSVPERARDFGTTANHGSGYVAGPGASTGRVVQEPGAAGLMYVEKADGSLFGAGALVDVSFFYESE